MSRSLFAGITVWLWSFGDGYTSILQHPTHLYPAIGAYAVTLTITSDLETSHLTVRCTSSSSIP